MKRTERLDREREVALPEVGPGVFTTKGDLGRTPEEEEEFRANLVKASGKDAVGQYVVRIMQEQGAFMQAFLMMVSDHDLSRANFIFEGSICVARINDQVMARYSPNCVPEKLKSAVELAIKQTREIARQEKVALN